ncbi:MAG: hypothetical protein ACKVS7_09720 [Gemmatimonadaceae bacterium]
MTVLVEAISVIIRIPTLEKKYPGGLFAYERDCPNGSFCIDRHLTRVGFMAPDDTRRFVERLQKLGLEYLRDGEAVDLVVVDQLYGPTSRCRWLKAARHPDGFAFAWKARTVPGSFAYPDGWSPAQSAALDFAGEEEAAERLMTLKREKGFEVALDFKTGREVVIARSTDTENSS